MPALCTSTCSSGAAAAACAATSTTPSWLERSPQTGSAPDRLGHGAAASCVRAWQSTRAPSAVNRRAISSPRPRLVPVTSAVLPTSLTGRPCRPGRKYAGPRDVRQVRPHHAEQLRRLGLARDVAHPHVQLAGFRQLRLRRAIQCDEAPPVTEERVGQTRNAAEVAPALLRLLVERQRVREARPQPRQASQRQPRGRSRYGRARPSGRRPARARARVRRPTRTSG